MESSSTISRKIRTIKVPARWICDTCGEWIDSPEQGWLEWEQRVDARTQLANFGFRIVHHRPASPRRAGCYDSRDLTGNHLQYYVGSSGMSRLFALLDPAPNGFSAGRCAVENIPEFVQIMRRLLMPNYEEARRYWSEAEAEGFFEGGNEYRAYDPTTLRAIIRKFGPQYEPWPDAQQEEDED